MVSGFAVLSVVSGLVIVGLGVTVVFDISDVTGVAVDLIINSLAATVGEDNGVSSLGVVTIAGLVLVHIDVVVIVFNGPVEFVVSGGLNSSSIHLLVAQN